MREINAAVPAVALIMMLGCSVPKTNFYAVSFGQVVESYQIKGTKAIDSAQFYANVDKIVKSTFINIYYGYFGLDTSKVFIEISDACRFAAADIEIDLDYGVFKKKLVYNRNTLKAVYNQHPNTWAIKAIIAHEVSHIVNVDRLYSNQAKLNEIWADYFAGLHMRRMGATEKEAVAPFRFLNYETEPGYPNKEERVKKVIDRVIKIFALARKHGIPLLKEFLEVGKKEIFKQIVSTGGDFLDSAQQSV